MSVRVILRDDTVQEYADDDRTRYFGFADPDDHNTLTISRRKLGALSYQWMDAGVVAMLDAADYRSFYNYG